MKPDLVSPTELARLIRDVPDFPRPGILFKDITPLLGDARAFRSAITHLADLVRDLNPELIVGGEARGFLFASALATAMDIGFAPVRKPGKLPWKTVSERYELEYGHDELHLHADAIAPGTRVLVVDDLLATGGTAAAASRLVTRQGGEAVAVAVLVELEFLRGRERLSGTPLRSVIRF